MAETQKKIPTIYIAEDFKYHLNIKDNKRILFSAPFGAGKTQFLDDFFLGNKDILSLSLYPIDYSVASNEDIFELIKHDLINALIEKHENDLNFEDEGFTTRMLAETFLGNKADISGVLKAIISAIPVIGKPAAEIAEAVITVKEDYNEFIKAAESNEEANVMAYLSKLMLTPGSIRENDAITCTIKDFVRRIKEANGGKNFVLVVDDLDRLDPDHVFRLFNIFTAHHDSKSDGNKFNFDQIIFVCDVENIHHMFIHKYGKHVDFAGYIDKFYSSHIYYYDFKGYLKGAVKTILLNKYNFDFEFTELIPRYLHSRYDFKNSLTDFYDPLQHIIYKMIDHDIIKIRSFGRFQFYRLPNYKFGIVDEIEMQACDYPFLVLIATLQQFFPRLTELEQALETLSSNYVADYLNDEKNVSKSHVMASRLLIGFSLPFLLNPKVAFVNEPKPGSLDTTNEHDHRIRINYEINLEGYIKYKEMYYLTQAPQTDHEKTLNSVNPNPYWFLSRAFKNCLKKKYFRNS